MDTLPKTDGQGIREPSAPDASQKTVLLNDTPSAGTPFPQISAAPLSTANLSTNVLAALAERYDILGEAGRGSMGNVYRARDRETGEIVALKLINPEIVADQSAMERFKRELLLARKITHKNVCRVYEFNRIGGIAFTSMEFVQGESLRSVLNRFGGLPVRKGTDLALQLCSGLAEAHAQGIVHRDLKPENVMIDSQGNAKIMDFGIARSMDAATRLTGAMVGTPAYMAPEQVAGKPVDYRTDIYSMGLMLYEMFTGSQTFHADTPIAVALKQLRETPPPPHEVDPTFPVFLERAILKCLEKEPDKRFSSVAELAGALRPGASGAKPLDTAAAASTRPVATIAAVAAMPTAKAPKPRRTPLVVWALLAVVLLSGAATLRHWIAQRKTRAPQPAPILTRAANLPQAAIPSAPRSTSSAALSPVANAASSRAPAGSLNAAVPAPVGRAPARLNPPNASAGTPPSTLPARAARASAVLAPLASSPRRMAQQPESQQRPFEKRPSSNAGATKYVWVGRFEKEDRAQNVAGRLENLNLPALVLPRRGPKGKFFVVLTGPFPEQRAQNVVQRLWDAGFFSARVVKPQGSPQFGSR